MQKNKFNFTIANLNNLPFPKKGSKTFYDLKENGLSLIVSYGGTKTFYLYKKIHGRPVRMKIDRFPDISVESARKRSTDLKAQINQGLNPNEEKHNVQQDITLQEAFHQYMEQHSRKYNKERTVQENLGVFKRYLQSWNQKRLLSLTRNEIERKHSKIRQNNGIYAGNDFLKLLRQIYNKAIDWGWKGTNPTLGIKKFKEQPRERFLQPNELQQFFKALDEEENHIVRDYIYMSLFTGQRRSNVLAMRWVEIDFESKIWRIPETKNGDPLNVPLIDPAIDILKTIKTSNNSKWVFPSPSATSGHLVEPKSVWKRILKRAGIENLRLHDLRRTMGSYQAMTGANGFIIGKSLGHKSQQATAIYARMNLDTVRESMKLATNAMLELKE